MDTKDELRAAFYYALHNTVVARNMDRAAEIAYAPGSRLKKVVTLKVSSPSSRCICLRHTAFNGKGCCSTQPFKQCLFAGT